MGDTDTLTDFLMSQEVCRERQTREQVFSKSICAGSSLNAVKQSYSGTGVNLLF